ncbi:phage/plasmid primase, P4 family [Dehalococcoidia bacterium]|nr:phage/plasmid primase, P4 family [Dehalococcoidia bacterium]
MSESSRDGLTIEIPVNVDALQKKEITRLVRDYLVQSNQIKEKTYLNVNAKDRATLDIESLICDLLREFNFKTFRDNEEIVIYQDGVWRTGGEVFIKNECERRVGVKDVLTTHNINEITAHIQRSTYVDRRDFNKDKFTINLQNGLLDVRTRELKPHTTEHLSTIRIPVIYNPTADCPRTRQFFEEILHMEDIPIIEELFGYILIPDYTIQKGFLFIGDGANGKTVLLNLLKNFVGKDNCASIAWQSLEGQRFAKAELERKLLNIYSDLPAQNLRHVSAFKMLTGGDLIGAERKFKDYFHFVNFARLVFSANKPPKIENEDSYAFWRRWVILDFPNKFSDELGNRDKDVLSKLTTEDELSGLLNIALDGLNRLLEIGDFSYTLSVDAVSEKYIKASDPIHAFVSDRCQNDIQGWISKDELYEAYLNYCEKTGIPKVGKMSFGRQLMNTPGVRVKSARRGPRGERQWGWEGIKINERESAEIELPGWF